MHSTHTSINIPIPHYMDLKEEYKVFQHSGLQISFFIVCLPHVPFRISLQCDHALRWWQKESTMMGWGCLGWTSSSSQLWEGCLNPVLLTFYFKAVWISLKCPYLEVLNYEVFLFGKNIIVKSAAGVTSSMVQISV